jgi:hypothetical protein
MPRKGAQETRLQYCRGALLDQVFDLDEKLCFAFAEEGFRQPDCKSSAFYHPQRVAQHPHLILH